MFRSTESEKKALLLIAIVVTLVLFLAVLLTD